MADGKSTIDDYKKMERFLGCDCPDYKERYEKMVERRNQKYGIQEPNFDVGEFLETWEFLFKKESK